MKNIIELIWNFIKDFLLSEFVIFVLIFMFIILTLWNY